MFPNKFRNIFVAETIFPGLPACFRVFPGQETLFSRLGMLEQCFKTSAIINNTLRFVRANVPQKMFPNLPTVGNMTKHRQETMFPQQCFLVCPGLAICILSKIEYLDKRQGLQKIPPKMLYCDFK